MNFPFIAWYLHLSCCVQADGVPLHEPGDQGGVVPQRRGGVQPAQAPGGGGGGGGGRQQDAAAV